MEGPPQVIPASLGEHVDESSRETSQGPVPFSHTTSSCTTGGRWSRCSPVDGSVGIG